MIVEDKEQIGRIDPAYLLRGLALPEIGMMPVYGDDGRAAQELRERRAAVRLVAAQVAFYAGAASHAHPPPTPHPNSTAGPPPLVCVVGCGQLGEEVLRTLLALGWPPSFLGACSRNPQRLSRFENEGVQCSTDAGRFAHWDPKPGCEARGVRVFVLCVPYSQLANATTSLEAAIMSGRSGHPSPVLQRALVVSCVAGVGYGKLKQLLPHAPNIVRTLVSLDDLATLASPSSSSLSSSLKVGAGGSRGGCGGGGGAAHSSYRWTANNNLRRASRRRRSGPSSPFAGSERRDVKGDNDEDDGVSIGHGTTRAGALPGPQFLTEAARHLLGGTQSFDSANQTEGISSSIGGGSSGTAGGRHALHVLANFERFYLANGSPPGEARTLGMHHVLGMTRHGEAPLFVPTTTSSSPSLTPRSSRMTAQKNHNNNNSPGTPTSHRTGAGNGGGGDFGDNSTPHDSTPTTSAGNSLVDKMSGVSLCSLDGEGHHHNNTHHPRHQHHSDHRHHHQPPHGAAASPYQPALSLELSDEAQVSASSPAEPIAFARVRLLEATAAKMASTVLPSFHAAFAAALRESDLPGLLERPPNHQHDQQRDDNDRGKGDSPVDGDESSPVGGGGRHNNSSGGGMFSWGGSSSVGAESNDHDFYDGRVNSRGGGGGDSTITNSVFSFPEGSPSNVSRGNSSTATDDDGHGENMGPALVRVFGDPFSAASAGLMEILDDPVEGYDYDWHDVVLDPDALKEASARMVAAAAAMAEMEAGHLHSDDSAVTPSDTSGFPKLAVPPGSPKLLDPQSVIFPLVEVAGFPVLLSRPSLAQIQRAIESGASRAPTTQTPDIWQSP